MAAFRIISQLWVWQRRGNAFLGGLEQNTLGSWCFRSYRIVGLSTKKPRGNSDKYSRSIIGNEVQLPEYGAQDQIQFTPSEASLKSIGGNENKRRAYVTYFIPKQLRGPLENETRYFSSSAESFWSHLSGLNDWGSGKISGFLWTMVAPIDTTV